MRVWLPLLVVPVLWLAGCADTPTPSEESGLPPTVAGPARFEDNTGAIDGLVVDEELRPLPSTQVLLQEAQLTTETDAEGRFVFNNLEPRRYTLHVARLGAESRAVGVDVVEGEAVQVQITLRLIEISEPRVVTLQQKGMAGCFVSVRTPGSANQNIYCGHAQSQVGRNKHLIYWPPIKPMTDWSGTVFEMSWRSTQAAGTAMQGKIYIAYESKLCGGFELVFFEGTSPLRGEANATLTSEFLSTASKECPKVCNYDSCELMTWVGGVPHVAGSSSPADVGLLFEQSYEHYHTAFFAQDAPPGFSALPDA